MNKPRLVPKISNRLTLNNTVLIISAGVGIFFLAFLGAFFFFNLGNHREVLANSDGTCLMTVGSGNTGNNDSFQPYTVHIEAEVLRIVPDRTDCQWGYNFNAEIAYNVSFEGTSRLYTFQGSLVCDNYNLFFEFPYSVRMNGGTGTFITSVNPWRGVNDCNTVTPETLGCTALTITIEGEGLPRQTNVPCESNDLLPIVLNHFKAQVSSANTIIIDWGTVSEKENDFFTLEHSRNGKTFNTIAEIAGAGDSNKKLEYSYEHHSADPGMNFYRLKQTDFNGDFEYFNIININKPIGNNPNDQQAVSFVGPNPFRESFKISYTVTEAKPLEFYLTSADGAMVYSEVLTPAFGDNEFVFNTPSNFKPGVYIASIKGLGSMKPVRVIKN